MKERPILFSPPMVRAILDGRKTMMRRVVKLQPCMDQHSGLLMWAIGRYQRVGTMDNSIPEEVLENCPYGQPGDRLWVRETWQGPLFDYDRWDAYREDHRRFEAPAFCRYEADGGAPPEFVDDEDELQCKWRPSIHMPRWASRITLEVTGVRVERLQEISEDDLAAEGIQELWSSINGAGSWEANPWVWVVEFRRIEQEAAR